MPRKKLEKPQPPKNRSADDYDAEHEAEIMGTPLSDDDQKVIAAQRAQQNAYTPVIEAALGCALEYLPNHPDFWRTHILDLLPQIPEVMDSKVKAWLKEGEREGQMDPDKLEVIRAEALMEQMMRIHTILNTAVPQSAFYIIPETGEEKDARRKREAANKVEEQEFCVGHPVFYLDKRALSITPYPMGLGDTIREALKPPIESATLPRLKSLYNRLHKAKTQAAEGGSLQEVKPNENGRMQG